MRAALAAAALGAMAGTAYADPQPLPVVERAGDANLEPVGPHTGVSLTASLLATSIISADSSGDVGRGPGLSLRVGRAATPDTLITLEITGGSMLHEHGSTLFTNNAADFLLGAQHYAKPTLWLRASAGIGSYIRRGIFIGKADMPAPDQSLVGAAALVGVGLDLMRRHKWALGLEGFTSLLVERNGITTASGIGLNVSYQ
jgi:hypothetical protein